jgi:hypothetical protein
VQQARAGGGSNSALFLYIYHMTQSSDGTISFYFNSRVIEIQNTESIIEAVNTAYKYARIKYKYQGTLNDFLNKEKEDCKNSRDIIINYHY